MRLHLMRPGVSAFVLALSLIVTGLWTWPGAAIAQGYKSGTRHSPVDEAGVKPCDYWDEYTQYDPVDNSWRVQHADGTVVIKSPNQPATIIPPNRDIDDTKLDQFYIGRYRFRDDSNGAVLTFKLWDIRPMDEVTIYGQWVNADGGVGQITAGIFDLDWHDQGRILMWWVVPQYQDYGSAVLYPSADGKHLNGQSMFQGRISAWNLTLIDE